MDHKAIHTAEFRSLNQFQQSMFNGQRVENFFGNEQDQIAWSTPCFQQFENVINQNNELEDGDESFTEITYNIKGEFDIMRGSYINFILPEISVYEEYRKNVRICWPKNPFLSIIGEAELCSEDTIDNIDYIILCNRMQWHIHKRKLFSKMIGNISQLTYWNSYLPAYTCSSPQLWFYGLSKNWAIPLHLLETRNYPIHKYKFRLDISKFLRMQYYSNGDWQDIPVNFKYIKCPENKNIPAPNMFGIYHKITLEEKQSRKNCEFYYNFFKRQSNANEISFGENIQLQLKSTSPILQLFYVAENMTAKKYNDYTNFTSSTDRDIGTNIFKNVTLKYNDNFKLKDVFSQNLSNIYGFYNFPKYPCEEGYNAIHFGYGRDLDEIDLNINANALDAIIRIGTLSSEDKDTKFLVHLCTLHIRKIKFIKGSIQIEPN